MEWLEVAPLLVVLAFVSGAIDAIAGGGGLLTIPALLWAGLPPVAVLATNKAQAVFGSFAATVHFARRGMVKPLHAWRAVLATFIGAGAGALLVQYLASDLLEQLIPVLLIGFALYFGLSPRVADIDSRQRLGATAFALLIGLGVGFYDGFFGPGTGTFFAAAYVALLGYNLRRATAHAKLLNFTSNLAALLFFAAGGHVVWTLGLLMAGGQLLGGWLGAHLVLRHGARLVRPVLVAVSLVISVKLLF
ncbi:TSUP family transporter [Thiorhodovibrio frisius]|uniref:Probable membrane transporter protein n=1 Tax=Thiorhodovibrio frisius TaxID=631362 RepID=H8Z751_9GAMM|nr:TSUP family transporter [Thiorhodovibrio frisius]EIC20850.1 putative permease [Thiorhodovibrio frisius]WPL21902.1 Sulfite exporter TauE/SafE [Thiorhodovibrio frisius]